MQITITGGAGSLAQYVIQELEPSHDLVLFDRVPPGRGRVAYETGHRFVHGDLTNLEDCQRAVAGADAIVHLGGIIYPSEEPFVTGHPEQARLPYDETMRVNTMGTYYLLEAARRAKVGTVVMASSNCVLGHGYRWSGRPFPFEYLPVDEQHPLDFEDSYSLSTLVKEQTVQAFCRAYGMRGYALRPAGIQRPERQAKYAESYRPPDAWTDWLYAYVDIRDIARAFRLCLEAAPQLPQFDAYYVNAADTLVLEDSRALVERLRPSLLPKLRDLTGRHAFISTGKAERAFGFRAEHSWTEHLVPDARAAGR